jgi:hypothetical protein
MNYFNKLPIITYDNKVAVNILARAKLSDQNLGEHLCKDALTRMLTHRAR